MLREMNTYLCVTLRNNLLSNHWNKPVFQLDKPEMNLRHCTLYTKLLMCILHIYVCVYKLMNLNFIYRIALPIVHRLFAATISIHM